MYRCCLTTAAALQNGRMHDCVRQFHACSDSKCVMHLDIMRLSYAGAFHALQAAGQHRADRARSTPCLHELWLLTLV